MNPNDYPDLAAAVKSAGPGAAGSLVSLLFIKDTWPRRFAQFFAGAAMAYFGTPWAAKWSGLDAGFAGFLLGLGGMAVVTKCFDWWQKFDVTKIATDLVRKWFGLSDDKTTGDAGPDSRKGE